MTAQIKRILALLLLVPVLALAADSSSEDARKWLDKMAYAMKSLNYEGTFVHLQDNQIEAMRIYHGVDEQGEHERLLSLTGEAREIVRDNDVLRCILPDSRAVVVEKSRSKHYIPAALLEIGSKLGSHYDFKVLGMDRMVGMTAQVVGVMPRDPYRYGHRLWLDEHTGMLLKSDLVNEQGEVVEQLMFTSLKLQKKIPMHQLKPAISGRNFTWYNDNSEAVTVGNKKAWSVTQLPAGFMMSMHQNHGLPTSKMPVEHLMFTDGLSSVSVFIEKPEHVKEILKGASRMGAVNVYGTMVAGHQVTVMGEVPQAAVVLIGESVRYSPADE